MKRVAVNLKSVKSFIFARIRLHFLIYVASGIPKSLQKMKSIVAISWKNKGNKRKKKLKRIQN